MSTVSQLHKFSIECSAIFENGDSMDLSSMINAVAVRKNYLSNIFPLYVVSLDLPDIDKLKMMENEFYLSLKIYRITVTELSVTNDVETSSLPDTDKIIVSILLKPFDNSKLYQHQKVSDVDDSDMDDILTAQKVPYVINCVPKEQLQINNSILNSCYADANLSEVTLNLISDVYTKDIYYQESFNKTRYQSILIPPGGLIQSLKYLQSNFMLYKYNFNMFFEYDKLYVYDIFDLDRPFRNSLNINVDNEAKNADQMRYAQNFVDDDENVQKYLDTNPVFISQKDIGRYKKGNKLIMASYDDNYNLVTRLYDDGTESPQDKKNRVMWNKEQDQTFEAPYLNDALQISQISFSNFDPTYIEPDTMITISGSAQPYINGTYILSGTDAYYSSEDKKTFSNSVIYHLIKKEK